MKRQYWFYRHPKFTLSAFALIGCVALIVLAELSARALLPEWAPPREERVKFWVYDELLGWAHAPNQHGRFNHRDFSVEVVINSQGMRDSEYSVERTGKRRMLVLGDSYGWGFGVEHSERFSEIMEDAYPDWEIINASVSGYGTDQEFLFLRERGMAFKPDVVLLLFYAEDFVNNNHDEQYWYFKPLFRINGGELELHNVPVPKATTIQRLKRFVLGRTYLGRILHLAKCRWLALSGSQVNHKIGNTDRDSSDRRSRYHVTDRLITSMNELCKKNGSLFLLVSIPMGRQRRTVLQRITEEQRIPHLQLDADFESTTTSVMFPHDRHWNEEGHRIAANAIDRFLRKSGVFNASESEP